MYLPPQANPDIRRRGRRWRVANWLVLGLLPPHLFYLLIGLWGLLVEQVRSGREFFFMLLLVSVSGLTLAALIGWGLRARWSDRALLPLYALYFLLAAPVAAALLLGLAMLL